MKDYYNNLSCGKRAVYIGFLLPALLFVGGFIGFSLGIYSVNFAPACENRVIEYTCTGDGVDLEGCVEVQTELTGCEPFTFMGLVGWEGRSALGFFSGVGGGAIAYVGTALWLVYKPRKNR